MRPARSVVRTLAASAALLAAAPLPAQAPDHERHREPAEEQPAITASEVPVDPMDRMRSRLTKQLDLLRALSEISGLVQELHAFGEAGLELLREDIPFERRIRAAVRAYVPPPPPRPDTAPPAGGLDTRQTERLEKLEQEIAGIRGDIENGLLRAVYPEAFRPAAPAPEPANPEPPEWKLDGSHVRYFQLPDPGTGTGGHVVLDVADQRTGLGLRETAVLAGRRITLREMAERDGRVRLTFTEDGEPTRIDFH